MNVVDSCAWLEYFADGPNANEFAAAIEDIAVAVVPAICIYEVFKRTAAQRSEAEAHLVVAAMQRGRVVLLDADLAVAAAKVSKVEGLAMADAIILATAHRFGATLWTQDAHFEGKTGVQYRPKAAG